MGNKMNKVLPGLYIGSARDAHDVEELMKNKISHILAVHENAKPDLPGKEYLCLSVADSPSQNIASYFAQCNVFIQRARRTGNVLVHCQMGVSRSATIVVAYLMTVTRLSWKDALAALKAVRPFVNPNLGFQKQLMFYEQETVEAERTRLKTLFPLSQFNDVVHCEQLLEMYRLCQLRNEQPMEVDVYPLALNAYGTKDFASLRLESSPANVVFCGPVSNPASEEDCLVQRLEHVHLNETFKSVDTFSCGSRPSPIIVRKTGTQDMDILSSYLLNDVQEIRSTEKEKNSVSGNGILPSLLNSVSHECRSNEPKSRNDATLESLFSNSVSISKNSANNIPLIDTVQESKSQETRSTEREKDSVNGMALPSSSLNNAVHKPESDETKSSNDAAIESFFSNSFGLSKNPASDNPTKSTVQESRSQDSESSNDAAVNSIFTYCVCGSKNSASKQTSSEAKDASAKPQVSSQLTEKDLREIGRAYLRKHVNIWHDMSETDEDEEEKLPKVKTTSNDPSQTKNTSNGPTQLKITSNDPSQIMIIGNSPSQTKITSSDPTQLKITSNDPTQFMIIGSNPSQTKITSSNPTQLKITSNDPTQFMIIGSNPSQTKITSSDPTQLKITSNDPNQNRIVSNGSSQTKIMGNNHTQKRLSGASKEKEITLLPTDNQLDEFFRG